LEMVEVENYSVDSNAFEEVDININFRIEGKVLNFDKNFRVVKGPVRAEKSRHLC
jgi:hypothetical protein